MGRNFKIVSPPWLESFAIQGENNNKGTKVTTPTSIPKVLPIETAV
jgi:hypothetical protein